MHPRPIMLLLSVAATLFACALAAPLAAAEDGPAGNLLTNGDFEQGAGEPKDWPTPDGATWEEEDGNRFLRLRPAKDGQMLTVYRRVAVQPGHEAMRLTFRARANDLQRGKANWHDGRVILDFKNDAGKKLKPGPGHPSFRGTTEGWVERSVEFLVPEGATRLEVMPALFMVKSGTLDLDDFVLTPIDPAPVIEKREAARAKREADIAARAAKVKPQVPAPSADQLPPALKVVGNQVHNDRGEVVWLQGVSIPSMSWSAGGEQVLESVRVAVDEWNANVIRLAVKEDFWNGTGAWQKDGGAGYRQLVEDAVNLAASKGAYTVIDLHRFRAPKPEHAAFWEAVADKYGNHPAVLFELFNEPHDISWDVWKNGGFVSTRKKQDTDAIAENKDKLQGFETMGMQALLDVVRERGAKNIVIVGGLDWSYDLSGVLQGYALDDRGGRGIMYSTHVYPWKSGWQKAFLDAAEKYPLFIGECGAPQERFDFIPPERHEDPSTWVPDFLGVVQKHRLHWTAWAFHPKAGPAMLVDWSFEPNDFWGAPAKRALAGERFETKRLR